MKYKNIITNCGLPVTSLPNNVNENVVSIIMRFYYEIIQNYKVFHSLIQKLLNKTASLNCYMGSGSDFGQVLFRLTFIMKP